jgi:hypothetical protein
MPLAKRSSRLWREVFGVPPKTSLLHFSRTEWWLDEGRESIVAETPRRHARGVCSPSPNGIVSTKGVWETALAFRVIVAALVLLPDRCH